MKIVREFSHDVREIEHLEIRMSDGCRLAARMWVPNDATERPVPAILEYIPYRKNDLTAARDALAHPFIAGHGYASIRVDLRGSGESEGVLRDEYLQQELDDGAEAIAWIAAQPWCDGNVGMTGISWGGFNGLQIAAMQPPALKAVITCSSTDDRYADDVHYMGGCLLTDNLSWASIMFARNTCPPDPRLVGEKWREMWLARLKEGRPWIEPWLEHQTRDAYWRHGSICQDFSRIRCPVYAVGGWADGYVNAVFRLLQGLEVPRKGLVGPWAHTYPHLGQPGPAIGFLQESLRWWDHWLKGRNTGILDEPMLRAWIQDSAPPSSAYSERPGRWVAEPCWPTPNVRTETLPLGPDRRLGAEPDGGGSPAVLPISSPLTVGLLAGKWCSYAVPGDLPGDQRTEDAGSLIFETAPLPEPLEILGEAVLDLELESDRPVAMIAARLNDVAPNGAATRVTYGLLNLTHRDSHEHPESLEPGRRYRVRIPFKHVGQSFAPGHRLRLALSTSYWPIAWAPPEPVTLTVHTAESRLHVPIRTARPEDASLPAFFEAEGASPLDKEGVEAPESSWVVMHDVGQDKHVLEIKSGLGTVRFPSTGLLVTTNGFERYSVAGHACGSQKGEARWSIAFSRDGWQVETTTQTTLTCDAETFHVKAELKAFENGTLTYEQLWQREIPRNLG